MSPPWLSGACSRSSWSLGICSGFLEEVENTTPARSHLSSLCPGSLSVRSGLRFLLMALVPSAEGNDTQKPGSKPEHSIIDPGAVPLSLPSAAILSQALMLW